MIVGKIKNNMFTMRTKDCEVQIIDFHLGKYMVKILTQPNNHAKALPVGKILTVREYDIEIIEQENIM